MELIYLNRDKQYHHIHDVFIFRLQMDENNVVLLLDDNVQIRCDRNILVAASPYFNAMFSERFTESDKREIHLHGISKGAMETLICYAKKSNLQEWCISQLDINSDNVINILQASGMLQFEPVRKFCCKYILLEALQISNALQLLGM